MAELGTRSTIERVEVGHSLPKVARACALLGVSESPGRNASERTGGPEILKPWRPSLTVERRRQHGPSHLADAAGHSGGVRATAR